MSSISSNQRHEDNDSSDKYEQLEGLLHQVFVLAGEIAEDKAQQRTRSDGQLPGECIVLRKEATGPVPTGTEQQTIEHILPETSSFLDEIEEEENGSQGPSAAPSVQEPFSPGTLALSLDAIVEDDTGTEGSFNDSGSNTSLASPRSPETPNKNHALLSIEEVQEYDTIAQHGSSLNLRTAAESSIGHERRAPPPSKATNTQAPASPQSCPASDNHTSSCQIPGSSELTLDMPQSPGAGREDHYDTTDGAYHSPPSRWRVRIVPVTKSCSPTDGSLSSISPTLVKLEAVFPYRSFVDSKAASSPAWSREDSYIIIGRPPVHASPGRPQSQHYG
ncbi:hypothetical protein VPNG_06872 [Cytospora leucostoma]|uniref:Uncharacterized protein n=1 Tax=Cytospora leucostoma TaxID=1230097 RepID=A0A423WVX9_9PEZI|nr:hypothetical protein VPNG_06872 [Cytospora leucostoma]